MMTRSHPASRQASTTAQIMGRPPTGWTTLGRSPFIRVPLPAARMIARGLSCAPLIEQGAGRSTVQVLADQDSNLDKQNQNLLCYRYTIGQRDCLGAGPPYLGDRGATAGTRTFSRSVPWPKRPEAEAAARCPEH